MTVERTSTPARVAAAVMAVQALVLMGLLVLAAVLALNPARSSSHLGMWIGILVVLTGLLLLLARALRQGRGWARGGTVAWNLMFLPVGWKTLGAEWWFAGVPVLALAVTGLVAALMIPPTRR